MAKGMRWDKAKYFGKPTAPAAPPAPPTKGAATHIKREPVTTLTKEQWDHIAKRVPAIKKGIDPLAGLIGFVRDGVTREEAFTRLLRFCVDDFSFRHGEPHDDRWMDGGLTPRRTSAWIEGLKFGGERCTVHVGFDENGEADSVSIQPIDTAIAKVLPRAVLALDHVYGHFRSRYGNGTPLKLRKPSRGYGWTAATYDLTVGLARKGDEYEVGAFIRRR